MKYMTLIAAAFLIATASCRKEGGKHIQQPLIKKLEHYIQAIGLIVSSYTYSQGKVQTMTQYSSVPSVFEYDDDQVIFTFYHPNGTFSYRETYELDNNGYVRKFHSTNGNQTIYYKIRPDGLVENEVNNTGGSVTERKYYYSNTGLLDSVYLFTNHSLEIITTYTAYDMEREYTISNGNFGKSFLGRKFIHPPLKLKIYYLDFQLTVNGTSTYTYDSQGRIIKDVRVMANNDNYSDTYEYY